MHKLFVPSQENTSWYNSDPIRTYLMKLAVTCIRNKRRGKGNAHTKTLSEYDNKKV